MKILCPTCSRSAPSDQVNVATDIAYCPRCDEGFRISESINTDSVNASTLRNSPKGAWYRQELDRTVVGATTRSPIAFFLVPFMCVWSGFSLGGIYGSQIQSGEFNLMMSLFGIPFVLGSLLFWALALMAVAGKVEVRIGRESSVFVGLGSIGWTRSFDWKNVKTIREDTSRVQYPGGHAMGIVLEGTKRIKFATGLNETRRYYILNTLKYLKAKKR